MLLPIILILKKNKIEGDKCTPKGTYQIGHIYYRSDRINKPITSLKIKKIYTRIIIDAFEQEKRGWLISNTLYKDLRKIKY